MPGRNESSFMILSAPRCLHWVYYISSLLGKMANLSLQGLQGCLDPAVASSQQGAPFLHVSVCNINQRGLRVGNRLTFEAGSSSSSGTGRIWWFQTVLHAWHIPGCHIHGVRKVLQEDSFLELRAVALQLPQHASVTLVSGV